MHFSFVPLTACKLDMIMPKIPTDPTTMATINVSLISVSPCRTAEAEAPTWCPWKANPQRRAGSRPQTRPQRRETRSRGPPHLEQLRVRLRPTDPQLRLLAENVVDVSQRVSVLLVAKENQVRRYAAIPRGEHAFLVLSPSKCHQRSVAMRLRRFRANKMQFSRCSINRSNCILGL